jgi:hypothetical protein
MQSRIFFALAVLVAAEARATDVIGNLNVDTRWTAAGSPYRLTGDVTVAPQATLTIEPGVTVEAATSDGLGSGTSTAKVELIVRGGLIADGSAAQPIVFRAASAGSGKWYGISFEPGAKASSLTQAGIADAEIAIWARTTNPVQLSDLVIAGSATGLHWQSTPGPTLTRVSFDGNGVGAKLEDDGATGATAMLISCGPVHRAAHRDRRRRRHGYRLDLRDGERAAQRGALGRRGRALHRAGGFGAVLRRHGLVG